MIATKRSVGGILGFWGGRKTNAHLHTVLQCRYGEQRFTKPLVNEHKVGWTLANHLPKIVYFHLRKILKKIGKKTPPVRAAMTGAPGKYVIDYFFCVG